MNIPRDIPAPLDGTANERAHRLDAEAEAFMAAHAEGLIRAWDKYGGDLTVYGGWNEAAVRQHWPELWSRWRALEQAKARIAMLIDNARRRLILDPGTK